MPPLLRAAIATVLGAVALDTTARAGLGGSPWGVPVALLLAAAHVPLLRAGDAAAAPVPERRAPAVVLAALVALAAAAHAMGRALLEGAVSPHRDSFLSVMLQSAERIRSGADAYGGGFALDGYSAMNPAGPLLTLLYAGVREAGWDLRAASVVAVALVAAAGALWAVRRGPVEGAATLGAIATVAVLPGFRSYLEYGEAVPVWALVAALPVALSARSPWFGAIAAGALAAASPGWLLLLPVVCAWLWRRDGRAALPALAAAALIPAIMYGTQHGHLFAMWRGIFSERFAEVTPAYAESRQPWAQGSLAPLAMAVNAGAPFAVWCVAAVLLLARRITRAATSMEATACLAAAAGVVVLGAPVAGLPQYAAHAILLAGLYALERPAAASAAWRWLAVPATAAVVLVPAQRAFAEGADHPIPAARTRTWWPPAALAHGWEAPVDHVAWGTGTRMELAFAAPHAAAGTLDLLVGTPPGPFTPFNPVSVRVNGRLMGVYVIMPGETRALRIPLPEGTLVRGGNTVTLEAEWARTPASLGIGEGTAPRSISISGIRFMPQRTR
jgi:hypothetical protein